MGSQVHPPTHLVAHTMLSMLWTAAAPVASRHAAVGPSCVLSCAAAFTNRDASMAASTGTELPDVTFIGGLPEVLAAC